MKKSNYHRFLILLLLGLLCCLALSSCRHQTPVMRGTVTGVNHDRSTIYVILDQDTNGEVVFPVDNPSRFEVGDVIEIRGSGNLAMSAPRPIFMPDGPLNIKIVD